MPSGSSGTRAPSSSALRTLSDDLAGAVERAARSIVAIHARPRIPASGVYWRDGIVVAASHTVRKDQDIAVTLPDGTRTQAQLAGRDGGTDLAILRFDSTPSSGSVSIANVSGRFSGSTGGGEITIKNANGEADLRTGGGEIKVEDSNLSGSVSTGGGVIRIVRVNGNLNGSSGSGPVIRADSQSPSSGSGLGIGIGQGGASVTGPDGRSSAIRMSSGGGDLSKAVADECVGMNSPVHQQSGCGVFNDEKRRQANRGLPHVKGVTAGI